MPKTPNYTEKHSAYLSIKRSADLELLCEEKGMTIIEAAEFLDGPGTHSKPQSMGPNTAHPYRRNGIAGLNAPDPRKFL